MIEITNCEVHGWKAALRGMRNPLNSWEKADSVFQNDEVLLGENDHALAMSLVHGGDTHSKFLRMINVTMDITAPLYWWKEFDTYKVGTVANSCSTMHTIHKQEFTLDMFAHEHLSEMALESLKATITYLNYYRGKYIKSGDRKDWYAMIQLLPSSFLQKRTVQLNYQVLKHIVQDRKNHRLDEWREFCGWCRGLPYAIEIFGEVLANDEG